MFLIMVKSVLCLLMEWSFAECSANGSSWHWDVGSCNDYLLLKGSLVGYSSRAEGVLSGK